MLNPSGTTERDHRLHPPFTQPDPGRRATPESAAATTDASSLPSIDDFVDELPSIHDFLMLNDALTEPAMHAASPGHAELEQAPSTPLETDAEGWARADWQSYDWSGLSLLGAPDPGAAEAQAAWSSTNWDASGRGRSRTAGAPGRDLGEDVADALDEIARRIRSGELSLEQFRGASPEAAVAAAFAALVRAKG